MAKPKKVDLLCGLAIKKRLGRPCGVGEHWLGKTRLGEYNRFSAVYRHSKTTQGRQTVRLKHYYPVNPGTTAQLAWQDKIRQGNIAWHNLTNEQKEVYNKRKYPKGLCGYTRFMKEYLN